MISPDTARAVEIGAGALFVVIDAATRFNRPLETGEVASRLRELVAESRGSTNAVSFFSAATLYTAVMLVLYGLLNLNERWIQNLVETSNGVPNNLSPPLLAALAVVVIIPRVKPFSIFEEHVRRFLQARASIPWEIHRFTESLRAAEFSIPEADPAPESEADGGAPEHDADELELSAGKTSSLLRLVTTWRGHRGFSGFIGRYRSVVAALEKEHGELQRRLEVQRSTEAKLGSDSPDAAALRKPLLQAFEELELHLEFLVAAAVLRCCRTESQRAAQLQAFGFAPLATPPPLTIGRIVLLGLSVWALFLLAFLGFNQLTRQPVGMVLLDAARISINLIVAVGTAYLIWRKARRPDTAKISDRPFHQYLLAGAVSFGAAFVINSAFALLHLPSTLEKDLDNVFARLPFSALTVGLAFGLGFLLDDPSSARLAGRRLRLLEAGTLGVFLGLLAVPVHFWLVQTFARHGLPFEVPLLGLAGIAVLIGFVLGFLVPTWCREIHEVDGAIPLPAPATPAPG